MRRVRITGAPPNDWVTEAEKITEQLRVAPDEASRKTIIDANDGFWRDDRIRVWLLSQFNNKCWYSEAFDSASSIHVDHYRPKCRIKSELGGVLAKVIGGLRSIGKTIVYAVNSLMSKRGIYFRSLKGIAAIPMIQ